MNKLARGLVLGSLALLSSGASGLGCSSGGSSSSGGTEPPPPPPSANLSVQVDFPDNGAKEATASVHVWAVVPDGDGSAVCTALIGGELDPYDLSLERRADVAAVPAALPVQASEVLLGPAFVYAEAVDFTGTATLAGCVPADVVQPSTSVTITLVKAGVYDCAAPGAKDGVPCDDGKACTIGEKCGSGQCKGGVPRDCTYLAESCTAASCDEQLGCIATPLPNTTPCDDGAYCTSGDVCTDGVCTGVPRDCAAEAGPCQVSVGCSEASQQCLFNDAQFGTSCDDGLYCTDNDACNSFGSCSGTPLDCSTQRMLATPAAATRLRTCALRFRNPASPAAATAWDAR